MAARARDSALRMAKPRFVVSRRDLMRGALVFAVVPFGVEGCSSEDAAPPQRFVHGIASGDPLPDGVILWTRVTGDGGEASIPVDWEVCEDPAMSKRVQAGTFATDPDRDYTVKVDVRGLQPGTTYYYRFRALGMLSCQSYAHGYFHAWSAIAAQPDLDAILFLGDYIYEYGDGDYGDLRKYEPSHECISLADYRARHAFYKRDKNLQAAHRQHPFVAIWDDHEVANDGYDTGAENHSPDTEGPWDVRKAAGLRAYREWMPIREQPSGDIFRTLAFGDLADVVLLDTRYHARTKQPGGFLGPIPTPDPTRTLLGDDQATWMEDQLRSSKARWKLIAQQVMVGNLILDPGKQLANLDQWHGYPESRNRMLDFFKTSGVTDIVVLTGDIHSSWANELVVDPNDAAEYDPVTSRGSLAVEFVTPGVTSPGIPDAFLGFIDTARQFNPHIKYIEPTRRGFIILDVTPERTQAAWYQFDDITIEAPQTPIFATAWSVKTGTTRLVQDAAAAPPRAGGAALVT
jgi:alkaline phosphatase D